MDIEKYLSFFKEKTGRVRGNNLEEKTNFLKSRWNKVSNDCISSREEGSDLSEYRGSFGKTHKFCYESLNNIELSKENVIGFRNHLWDRVLEQSQIESPIREGLVDASLQIIAELDKAIEELSSNE